MLRVQPKSHTDHPLPPPAASLPQQSAFMKAAAEATIFHHLSVCTRLARQQKPFLCFPFADLHVSDQEHFTQWFDFYCSRRM